jgi:hypothetical protein
MKVDIKELLWKAVILILLAVILANCWISYFLDMLSPLPLNFLVPVFAASVCGALLYFFIIGVRRAVYASIALCVVSFVIITLFMVSPVYLGILDSWIGAYLSLRYSVIAVIFSIPFAIGGSLIAAYVYPE